MQVKSQPPIHLHLQHTVDSSDSRKVTIFKLGLLGCLRQIPTAGRPVRRRSLSTLVLGYQLLTSTMPMISYFVHIHR